MFVVFLFFIFIYALRVSAPHIHIEHSEQQIMVSSEPTASNSSYHMATRLTPSTLATSEPALQTTNVLDIASDDPSVSLDWWSNAIEEDSFYSPLPFDSSESGLWNGRFVPPPPRPPFWDDTITSDGLTTCDLCTWALHDRNPFNLDSTISGKSHSKNAIVLIFWSTHGVQ